MSKLFFKVTALLLLVNLLSGCQFFLQSDGKSSTEDTNETLSLLPLFGTNQTASRFTVASDLSYEEFLYWYQVPSLTKFDTANSSGIKFGESFSQSFLGMTITTTAEKTSDSIITFTSSFDEGKIVIAYNQAANTFDYSEVLGVHDPNAVLLGDTTIDAVCATRIQGATLDPDSGRFQGIGRAAIYVVNDDLTEDNSTEQIEGGVQLIKYEVYSGGLESESDTGSGVYSVANYNNSGGIVDLSDFDESTLLPDFSQPFSVYEEYVEGLAADAAFFDSKLGLEMPVIILFRRDSTNSFTLFEDETNHVPPNDYPTASGSAAFLEANLPAYWKQHKSLAFPQ